jgi:ABC-type transport system substrate-binding protein
MRWRMMAAAAVLIGVLAPRVDAADAANSSATLHVRLRIAEHQFDPATINSAESNWIIGLIMLPPLRYDVLARPHQLRTNTAAALPEYSADRRQLTLAIKPGFYFADDPAFDGKRRELTAEDYVYTLKRHIDPAVRSTQEHYARETFAGFEQAFQAALKHRKFDYDEPLEGARAIDRYTLRLTLTRPLDVSHRLVFCPLFCVVAREAVNRYGERIGEHPVGPGPYRLAQWRRDSLVVLERNPNFPELRYDEQSGPGDVAAAQTAARLKGRPLPLTARVELSVITESEPSWFAFQNREFDLLLLPTNLTENAVDAGHLKPELAQRGVSMDASIDGWCSYYSEFNMDNPVVGGYTPEKVALRRAIGLALNQVDEIRVFYSGAAQPPMSLSPPGAIGLGPNSHALRREYDPAKARSILDTYGYRAVNGESLRRQPDGKSLTIQLLSFSDDLRFRGLEELWLRDLKAVGLRLEVVKAEPQALYRQARAGNYMVVNAGFCPGFLALDQYRYLSSHELGAFNISRFHLARYDELFDRAEAMSPGPEQAALLAEMDKLLAAYAPILMRPNPVIYALANRGVLGLRADQPYPDLARIGLE